MTFALKVIAMFADTLEGFFTNQVAQTQKPISYTELYVVTDTLRL
jgi:hypothetical protein